MNKTIAGILAGTVLLTVAQAADPLPEPFKVCASLRRDAERLACYDNAVALIHSGSTSIPAPSAENMFGASGEVAQPARTGKELEREEIKQISGSVTSLHRTDDGMIVLELDNGQTWRQQDQDVVLMINQGDQVTVTRAALGTFRISDKRGRSARVKRVR